MNIRTGSASAFQMWDDCPARWAATYTNPAGRPGDIGGDGALMGTAIHTALQKWVEDGHYQKPYTEAERTAVMMDLWKNAHREEFGALSDRRFDEGWDLITEWLDRTSFGDRTVLTTEVKSEFTLKTSKGPLPIYYVLDRCDRTDDGNIEVVDYKSGIMSVKSGDLHDNIQARVYGLAAQMQYPDAEEIWVTLDQLRYGQVSTVFTKEDNRKTYRMLQSMVETIIATKKPAETLCSTCRWCVRKHECKTLKKHASVSGPLAITDAEEAADRRHQINMAISGLKAIVGDLDEVIAQYADINVLEEFETDETQVYVRASSKRSLDAQKLSTTLGDRLSVFIAEYGGLTVGAVDKMLKDDATPMTDAEVEAIVRCVNADYSAAKVITKDLTE